MIGLPSTVHSFVEQVATREQAVRRRIHAGLLAATFWSAITLPFLYLPLLLTGLDTHREIAAFLVLVVLNALTLVTSHSYRSS